MCGNMEVLSLKRPEMFLGVDKVFHHPRKIGSAFRPLMQNNGISALWMKIGQWRS